MIKFSIDGSVTRVTEYQPKSGSLQIRAEIAYYGGTVQVLIDATKRAAFEGFRGKPAVISGVLHYSENKFGSRCAFEAEGIETPKNQPRA